jgi:hypothetical protein
MGDPDHTTEKRCVILPFFSSTVYVNFNLRISRMKLIWKLISFGVEEGAVNTMYTEPTFEILKVRT